MSRPPGQLTDISPVEEWEYDLIMPQFKKEHWRLVFEILWQIGPRIAEVLAILKTDINQEGVWITRSKRTDKLREHLPLTPDLYNRLLAYIRYERGIRVFPYTPSAAWLALKEACARAGVRTTIHPHSFRHSVGYRVAGANLGGLTSLAQQVTVQRVLGQKSLSSAARYFNPPPARIIDAIKKINEPVKIELPVKVETPVRTGEKPDYLGMIKKIQQEDEEKHGC